MDWTSHIGNSRRIVAYGKVLGCGLQASRARLNANSYEVIDDLRNPERKFPPDESGGRAGRLRLTNLAEEPADYLAAREQLRAAEVELMKQREHVAAMRRALPKGAVVKDYEFLEGPRNLHAGDTPVRKVMLSELFTAPTRPLVIYQFMYGKLNAKPCPMCTMWIDGINGVAQHIAQNIDLA
ncbi:MAG: DUF899 family protein, partial [Candidatus Acidiferrales bacterium]